MSTRVELSAPARRAFEARFPHLSALGKRDPTRAEVLRLVESDAAVRLPAALRDDEIDLAQAGRTGVVPSDRGRDEAFVAQAAARNPLVVDSLPDDRRRAVLDADPALAAAHGLFVRALEDADIEFPTRIGGVDAVREILKNRTEPRAPGDLRPTALVVMPKVDHNGAFETDAVARLCVGYRVLYFEADDDADLVDALRAVSSAGERAPLIVIGGHGAPERLAFGAPDPAGPDDVVMPPEELFLDVNDGPKVGKALAACVAMGGDVVLVSCSTGAGGAGARNLANAVAAMAPHATIHASRVPAGNTLVLDRAGRFVDAGVIDGPGAAYVVRAGTYRPSKREKNPPRFSASPNANERSCSTPDIERPSSSSSS